MSGAYRNQCQSVFRAPFPVGGKENADHQCFNGKKCNGVHGCGCGYTWNDIAAAGSLKPEGECGQLEQQMIDLAIGSAN